MTEPDPQKQSADLLAEALEMIAMPVARSTPRVETTASTQEQVQILRVVVSACRRGQDFAAEAVQERKPPEQWAVIADLLMEAGLLCRTQVVFEQASKPDQEER